MFDSSCYTHHRARDKDKFGSRSRHCVYLGYPFGKKGWRVYDKEKEEFLITRDVIFQETVFPFESILTSSSATGPDVMMVPQTIDDDWAFVPGPVDRGSTE